MVLHWIFSLYESISEALKAADDPKLKTERTNDIDLVFHKADEAIETLCRKYAILGLYVSFTDTRNQID